MWRCMSIDGCTSPPQTMELFEMGHPEGWGRETTTEILALPE
jgi:hypothetical protein